jgi:tetratricopeptide (TPR) repeat protein
MRLNLFYIFFFLSTFSLPEAFAQNYEAKLKKADSLFFVKKYTNALSLYQEIHENSDQFSLQMLLKMAFIKEALGDYTSALLYLNLYYNYNPNKKVLKKMEDLASKYQLQGYRYTDLEYFISLYNQYYYYIVFFFLACAMTYYIYLVTKKVRRKKLGLRPLLFMIILGAAFGLTNFEIIPPKGIINTSGTYLMSAPSAASEPLTLLDKGHRVMILDKEDVWYQIQWEDKEAYILESNLIKIGEDDK